MAADAVVEQVHRDALGGFFPEQGLQAPAEAVVVDDEKLDQHRFAGLADGLENRREGRLAIDEQAHLVVRQAWHTPKLGHRPQRGVGVRGTGGEGFFDPGAPVQGDDGFVHFGVGLAPRLDVGVEGAAAKNQVGHQGEIGNEQQRHGPGNGALGGPDGQHGVDRGDHPQKVNDRDQIAEHMRAEVIHGATLLLKIQCLTDHVPRPMSLFNWPCNLSPWPASNGHYLLGVMR